MAKKKKQKIRKISKKKTAASKGKSAPKRASAKAKVLRSRVPSTRARTKKPVRPKARKLSGRERRKFKRVSLKNLWVTELNGDYRFVAIARDISEGGIFLKGRLKISQEPSVLQLPLDGRSVELTALPIYDRLSSSGYGTGYRFVNLSATQAKELRSFISRAKRG